RRRPRGPRVERRPAPGRRPLGPRLDVAALALGNRGRARPAGPARPRTVGPLGRQICGKPAPVVGKPPTPSVPVGLTVQATADPGNRSRARGKERKIMRKSFEIGGLIAAVVLIAFGIGAIVMSINGRDTVRSSLRLEQITGTPDMTP